MELIITRVGEVRFIYAEEVELSALGQVSISRASHVEADTAGNWWADLHPVDGPVIGPFSVRSEALQAEFAWLQRHWLPRSLET